MPNFKTHDKVKVVSGPHAGKTGKVLTVSGRTYMVKTDQGSFYINERDLRNK
jgi:ribosomal protein L24